MIVEITGLPGHGKTLYALQYVKEWSERENRQVFYSGIADLMLPWTEIEPEKWFECPAGSIIVIDECQRVFRPRSMGKEVPPHVSKLETHRHDGFDIVLITQHPLLTDTSVRRLVGRHYHVVRNFGAPKSTIHEWGAIKDSCDKPSGRKDSVKHHWLYPKSLYGLYKSAEVHTVKMHLPKRIFLMGLLPLLAGAMIYYAVQYFRHLGHPKEGATVQSVSGVVAPGASVPGSAGGKGEKYLDPVADAKNYMFMQSPRLIADLKSAPKYDDLTKPEKVPVPAACVSGEGFCKCYTQQATPYPATPAMCADIVAHGFFQEFNPDGHSDRERSNNVVALSSRSGSIGSDAVVVAADASEPVLAGDPVVIHDVPPPVSPPAPRPPVVLPAPGRKT
ncbi:MAG: zonular occludens toxin domain-containing protein [Burkholderiales bacterium]